MNNRKYIDNLDGKINIVGNKIKDKRTELNYSRQYLSDQLMILGVDIPEHSIYDIETGKRSVVDYELVAIARILKMSTDELLEDFDNIINDKKD